MFLHVCIIKIISYHIFMTELTITVNEPLDLPTTKFASVDELLIALYHIKTWFDIDFRQMKSTELSDEIIDSVKKNQWKKLTSFSSISSK